MVILVLCIKKDSVKKQGHGFRHAPIEKSVKSVDPISLATVYGEFFPKRQE